MQENNRERKKVIHYSLRSLIYRDLIDDRASFELPFQVKRDELTICRDIINMEWTCKHAVCRVSLLRRYLLQTHTHTLTFREGSEKTRNKKKADGKLAKKDCVCVWCEREEEKGCSVCVAGGMKFNVRVEMRGFINSTSKWRLLLESCPSPAEFQYVVKKRKEKK